LWFFRRWAVFDVAEVRKQINETKYKSYFDTLWGLQENDNSFGLKALLGQFFYRDLFTDAQIEEWGRGEKIPDECLVAMKKQRAFSISILLSSD